MPDVHTIEYIWKSAQSFKPGRTLPIQSIILHSTDGREEGDVATLTGPHVSVHWYITRTGKTYHFVQNADTAYHVGRAIDPKYSNAAALGIEQEHFDDQHEDWPPEQIEQVARVVAFLLKRHGLMPTDIRSHADVAAPKGRKVDPMDYPWEEFFKTLAQKLDYDWQAVEVKG